MRFVLCVLLCVLVPAAAYSQSWVEQVLPSVEEVASSENGLDNCAGTLALGLDKRPEFRPNAWPIFCHKNITHPLMERRVAEIRADLASGRYSDEELAALREGRITIGMPREAIFYVHGSPAAVKKRTTAEGVSELVLFRFMSGAVAQMVIEIRAGKVHSIEE